MHLATSANIKKMDETVQDNAEECVNSFSDEQDEEIGLEESSDDSDDSTEAMFLDDLDPLWDR